MEKNVRIFLLSAVILMTLGISVVAQPALVTEVPNQSTNFVKIDDLVFFTSGDSLLRTDGTATGTILLKTGFNFGTFPNFTEHNGMLYFRNASSKELWRSDGTPSGTIRLMTSSENNVQIVGITPSYLFFQASETGSGRELFRTDGTIPGTVLLLDINSGAANGFNGSAAVVGNSLFFAANDGTNGNELWKSDGTYSGTQMVKDIDPGSGAGFITGSVFGYNNLFYFKGSTPATGAEPWVSDGTAAGTMILKDIVPGAGSFGFADYKIGHDGVVYFITIPPLEVRGNEESRADLWKTSGTSATTQKVEELGYDIYTFDSPFRIYQGKVYFFMRQDTGPDILMVTNGTSAGTGPVYNVQNYEGSIVFFEVVNDYMLFYGEADGHPTPFFRSDGTASGTQIFARFNSGAYLMYPREAEKVGDLVFYGDHDGPSENGYPNDPDDYYQLMQSDGITTQSVREIAGGSYRGSDNITDFNGMVMFTTRDDQYNSTDKQKYLWIYDPSNPPNQEECTASGTITREYWTNVPGGQVWQIPTNTPPTSTSELTIFEGPVNDATNYGARIRGYVCPPVTGDYIFWIASNDGSELWLSTDGARANRRLIASVFQSGATGSRQWEKFASQKSPPIRLVAGTRYYIEALHKQGIGSAHVAVGWQLPDGTLERPIPGNRLSPYTGEAPLVNITSPEDGQSFTAPATLVIEAEASDEDGTVTMVEFYEGANKLGEDLSAPYSYTWQIAEPGTYSLTAKATDDTGKSRTSPVVDVTINESSGCTASGTISREYWANVQGAEVWRIPTNTPPTSTGDLTIFEGPVNDGTNYGARIRGYICVPATGNYTFWIASNDASELWLSTDDAVENRRLIAYVNQSGATGSRQWDKFGSQRSAPVFLMAGSQYYIEALHKQGIGGAHVAVGWQLPDGALERPIPGNRLSPFEVNSARMTSDDDTKAAEKALYSQINIYPNPVQSGDAELTIAGYERVEEPVETQVEIINMTGEVVFAERILCGGNCSTYLMNVNKQLVPGVYLVNLKTNGTRSSKRLLVK